MTRIILSHNWHLLFTLVLAVGLTSGDDAFENSNILANTPAASKEVETLKTASGIKSSDRFFLAGGNIVEFRYEVNAPKKAAMLTKLGQKPMLLDQTAGAKLQGPTAPRTGPLRQAANQAVASQILVVLCTETRHHMQSGDQTSVTVGDFNIENFIVE